MSVLIALLALIIERIFGYPNRLVKWIGHPVIWQGAMISLLEDQWNGADLSARVQRIGGVAMLVVLIAVSLLVSLVLHRLFAALPFGWMIEAFVASSLLAQKSLGLSVRQVFDGLGGSISVGRMAVAKIVGRETDNLDEGGVSKAAIESLAENSSDAVIAPLFWMVLFGLPGAVIYKAINTADSMVGHKNARYQHFGWAAARLDDLVNWLPARLTFWFVVLAAAMVEDGHPIKAARAGYNDAPKHVSPNAGWPEAGFAGALGIVLGGVRSYGGREIDLAEMGSGRAELTRDDIARALVLYRALLNVALGMVCVVAMVVGLVILAL